MPSSLGQWLNPARPPTPGTIDDPAERRLIKIELAVVFGITLGLSGVASLLSILDRLTRAQALRDQSVAINQSQAQLGILDFLFQLLNAVKLFGWGALGVYLLVRAGFRLREVGLSARPGGGDLAGGAGLAALIGVPGLAFYLIAYQLGLSVQVQPSTLDNTWWSPVALTTLAAGNAFAEEVLVVGFLVTRLRQLGLRENSSLLCSAILRGSYHFYQGFGGFVGNIVMGLVFGRVWQRTNRLWPLVLAHTLIDVVAFVGYSLLRDHVSWLP